MSRTVEAKGLFLFNLVTLIHLGGSLGGFFLFKSIPRFLIHLSSRSLAMGPNQILRSSTNFSGEAISCREMVSHIYWQIVYDQSVDPWPAVPFGQVLS